MSQLSQQEIEKIEREAEVYAPDSIVAKIGYEKGATAYALKAKVLVEALVKISEIKLNTHVKLDWKDAADAIDIAKEALSTYTLPAKRE